MKGNKILSASLQNYLKAIHEIVKEKQAARVKDISKYLGVGPSSVSEALRSLADREYINYEPYGIVTLTEKGQKSVEDIIKRHEIICNFFENVLSVEKDDSENSACKIEHEIPDDVLDKFVKFLVFMRKCSCKEPKWMKSFKFYSENDDFQEKCKKCISLSQENPKAFTNKNCCGMMNQF